MSIVYIKGDALQSPDKYIAHGVNCGGVMGSGIALQVRNKYPEVYEDYKDFCETSHEDYLLGKVRKSSTNDGRIILNCFTQLHYGRTGQRFVSYDAVDDCMRTINKILQFDGQDHVSMPMIGAGLGGGHWPIIEQIIDHNIPNCVVKVFQL